MSFSIAIAGKGGSGKTSTSCLIIRYLKRNNQVPILAVDADGNANLGESLGYGVEKTIGSIIAAFNDDKISIPSGLTKGAFLELKLNEAIVENKEVDLITMGRGEGTGCYCYPNIVLKKFIDELKNNYAYMVMDNEAGMEHLSRRTTENINELIVVSDHSIKGVRTAARIMQLVEELKLVVGRKSVIINRVDKALDSYVVKELEQLNIDPIAIIPLDKNIYRYDFEKKSLLELPDESKAVEAIGRLMDNILDNKEVK
jgi:CO dehydrogenase maturation factor